MSRGDAESTLGLRMPSSNDQVAAGDTEVIELVGGDRAPRPARDRTGRVQVHAGTEIVERARRSEAVWVRAPVGCVIVEGNLIPTVRTEDGVTIIPVLKEHVIVEKRLVLRDELHVRRTVSGEDVEFSVTLRRQHVGIERVSAERNSDRLPLMQTPT